MVFTVINYTSFCLLPVTVSQFDLNIIIATTMFFRSAFEYIHEILEILAEVFCRKFSILNEQGKIS